MDDNTETTGDDTPDTTPHHELGDWVRIVHRLMVRNIATALAENDSDLREWMALRVLAGDIDAPHLAQRLAWAGRHLHPYAERGWITETDDGWALSAAGRAAKERLDAIVAEARERATEGVSPDELATTTATLEAIAGRLGWDENSPESDAHWGFGKGFGPGRHGFGPRGFGPGFGPGWGFGPGFGHGHGHGFGPGFGHAHGHGFGPGFGHAHGHAPHGEPCDDGRAHRHGGKGRRHAEHHRRDDSGKRERAYERGFEAGFTAARRSSEH